MTFFFSETFIEAFIKLLKSKAHSELEKLFIEQILTKSKEEIISRGTSKLNNSSENIFLKKRIKKKNVGKSSGYRAYFYLLIKNDSFDFLYIYPKTGRRSQSSVSKAEQKQLLIDYKACKEKENMVQVSLNEEENKIIDFFTKEIIFP